MDQTVAIKAYDDALDRLKAGKPLRVPKGTRICNDAVSLEAGRGKGSIKKSRPGYAQLVERIEAAARKQAEPQQHAANREVRNSERIKDLEAKLDAALARELSLVYELFEVKKTIEKLNGEKIIPIRTRRPAIDRT